MQAQSCLTGDTPCKDVPPDNVWHIRISQEMLRHRFAIFPVFPVPEKNRSAGC